MGLLRRGAAWVWEQWRLIHAEALEAPVEAEAATEARAGAAAGGGRRARRAAAAEERRSARPAPRLHWQPLVILLVTAVSLTFQEYWGDRRFFAKLFAPPGPSVIHTTNWELLSFTWWSGWRVLGYLVLPGLVVLLMPGERLRDYGLSLRGFRRHVWIYVGLFLAVLPLVIAASTTAPFQKTYPFYKLANRSTWDLVAWELLYAAQFLSLEFFFRGFMLHGLKRAIGAHAIWVMVVPYCMIHYGKPMPETMGAIVAGVILGTLSLRTRSIWCGVLIHVSVAVTMDLLALSHCPPRGPCRY